MLVMKQIRKSNITAEDAVTGESSQIDRFCMFLLAVLKSARSVSSVFAFSYVRFFVFRFCFILLLFLFAGFLDFDFFL